MKRVVIFAFLLLCTIVCSCEKNAQLDLLIGSWEVMESSTYKDDKTGRTEHYSDSTPLYFSFEKNGQGKIFREGTSGNFSYKYNNKDKSIEYQMDDGQGVWFIDILTEETLIFHEERERKVPMTEIVYHISATYKGKRI